MRHVKEAPPSAIERVRAANRRKKVMLADAALRRAEARAFYRAAVDQRSLLNLAPCLVPLKGPGPDRTWLWVALALAWPLLVAVFVL
jgi:hypothetical protein